MVYIKKNKVILLTLFLLHLIWSHFSILQCFFQAWGWLGWPVWSVQGQILNQQSEASIWALLVPCLRYVSLAGWIFSRSLVTWPLPASTYDHLHPATPRWSGQRNIRAMTTGSTSKPVIRKKVVRWQFYDHWWWIKMNSSPKITGSTSQPNAASIRISY